MMTGSCMASMTWTGAQASKYYGQSLRQIHFLPVASFGYYAGEAVRRTDTVNTLPMVIVGKLLKKKAVFIVFGSTVTHSNTSIKNNFFFQRGFLCN